MKPVLVGTYFLGHENVRLFLRDGDGGEFFFCPADKGTASIHLGCYTDRNFERVFQVLVHEALEFALARIGCRSFPDPPLNGSSGSYCFYATHEQMASVADMVGEFVFAATNDLKSVQKAYAKQTTKKTKTTKL